MIDLLGWKKRKADRDDLQRLLEFERKAAETRLAVLKGVPGVSRGQPHIEGLVGEEAALSHERAPLYRHAQRTGLRRKAR